MKLSDNLLSFAQNGDITVYERFRDYFNQYRAINFNAKTSYVTEIEGQAITFEEKEAQMNEALLTEIAKQAQLTNFSEFKPEIMQSHPNFKWATFAVIGAMIDMVLPEVLTDSIGFYAETKFGAYGDSFAFDVEPKDLFVISKGSKGKRHTELKKQFKGQVTAIPVEHDITVGVSLYRVLAGHESLAPFVMKAIRSIETAMAVETYTAFNTAMTNLPTTPTNGELKITGWTQDAGIALAQRVSAYNGGAKAVFIGTQVALSKVMPSGTNYRYDLDSAYVKLGYIQTAFGYDLMVMPQVADWENPHKLLLDDNRIYVVSPSSQKLIKLCIEGALMTIADDVYANANLTQAVTFKKNFVSVVATNSVAGLIILS